MTALRINESSGSLGTLQIADGYGGFLSGSLVAGSNLTIRDDGEGNFTLDTNEYIKSVSSNYLSTTGSVSFSGELGFDTNTFDIGDDVFFFVSGSLDGQNNAVFGGDVVVSGALSVANESIDTYDALIKNQYNTNDLDKNFLFQDPNTGKILKRDFKSSFYAKGGPNSTINFIVPFDTSRYPLNASNSGREFNAVFENQAFRSITSDASGQQNDTTFIFDINTTPSRFDTEFDFSQRSEKFIFDAAKTESNVENLPYTNVNGDEIKYGSFLADVTSEFNYSFWYLFSKNTSEYNVNLYTEGNPREFPGRDPFGFYFRHNFENLLDENAKHVTINKYNRYGALTDTYTLNCFFNEAKDVSREILKELGDPTVDNTLLTYKQSNGGSGAWVSQEEKFQALIESYVRNEDYNKVKLGTKLSSNRYEYLKAKYISFTGTDDTNDGLQARVVSTAADRKGMNSILFSLIHLYNSIADSSIRFDNTTKASYAQVNDRIGENIPWDFYGQIGWDSSGNSFPFSVSIQYFYPFYFKELSDTFDELIAHYEANKSTTGQIDALEVNRNYQDANNGQSAYIFFLKQQYPYETIKEYEEYLYYKSVFIDGNEYFDVTKRDFVDKSIIDPNEINYQGISLGRRTEGAEPESTFSRNKMITVLEPALLVTGSAVFLDPISVKKIYGQSPIEVNTVFQFGEKRALLDEEGNPLTGSSGQVLYEDTNLLSIGPRGIEGNTQITGSIDITGFDNNDGMRINMGNLVMTNDQSGFNMPQFNMINTNPEPYERPTILLSNNLSSFVSGTKAYQMGEVTFAGPNNTSPEDDQENILIRAQINESTGSSAVNYLSFDFYINEERNRFKNLDGTIPVENQKVPVLVVGQHNDDQVINENGISEGLGVRGNVVPLGVTDYTDSNVGPILSTDYTLGTTRFRWGGLHLGEESPVTFGNINKTHSKLEYDKTFAMPVFSGSVGFQHGLSGSLTTLLDGSQYIKGINGISVTTGSNGSVSISLDGFSTGSNRQTSDSYSVTGLSGSQIVFNQETFELANYNDNNIKFYLNGQLLASGSIQETLTDKTKDYFIDPDNSTVSFATDIFPEDVLSVVYYNDTSDKRGQYRYDRILSSDQPEGSLVWFNFDFGIIDNDYDKFEVYVNGQQLSRIENLEPTEKQPYEIKSSNRLVFDSDLHAYDIITLLFKISNPFLTGGGDDEVEEGTELNSKIKEVRVVNQDYQEVTPVTFSDLPFELDLYSKDVMTVYLNGQLLMPADALYKLRLGQADYYIENSTTIYFADVIKNKDIVTFDLLVPGYENAFADTVFVTANKSLLDNTVLLSGSGDINVDYNSENIIIKNKKTLVFNEILGGLANGSNTYFTFANTPFSSEDISVFVDGLLQVPSGVANRQDYAVTGSHLYFSSGSIPQEDSLVMAIYNKVVT